MLLKRMAGRLPEKIAIVTGAAGGIGRAIVERLVCEGARVVMSDVNQDKVNATLALLPSEMSASILPLACDVRNERAVENCVLTAIRHFGRVDIIVNNAAVLNFKPLAETTREDWLATLDVNLLGPALFVKEGLLRMAVGGSIVNISSVHAMMTSSRVGPYAAAKAALLSLTRTAAIEGREKNIRANAIVPGAIDTPMLHDNPHLSSGAEKLDAGEIGMPVDIANATLFLVSDEARLHHGIKLNCGWGPPRASLTATIPSKKWQQTPRPGPYYAPIEQMHQSLMNGAPLPPSSARPFRQTWRPKTALQSQYLLL